VEIPSWASEVWDTYSEELLARMRQDPRISLGRPTIRKITGLNGHKAALLAKMIKQGQFGPVLHSETSESSDGGSKVEAEEDENKRTVLVKGTGEVTNLKELISVSGTDVAKWRPVRHKVNTWTTAMGGDDGPITVRNWQVKADFEPRRDFGVRMPKFSEPLQRVPRESEAAPPTERCLLIGDPQFGFRRTRKGYLEPLHDRRVLDVALQIAAEEQPDYILFTGDMLDLAELSTKYPRPIELLDTTDPSFAEARWWLASFRRTCPQSRIICLEGNHDDRVLRAVRAAVPALATLQAPGDDKPALDFSRLLGCDDLDIEWVGPYGESFWLWDAVEFTHGDTVRSGSGGTVAAESKGLTHSKVFGHVHRVEVAHRTLWGPKGPHQVFAATPGCACRLAKGLVPSVKPKNNWQQAVGMITWDKEAGQEHITMELVNKGRCWWKGGLIAAQDQTAAIEKGIGWPMRKDWLRPEE